MTAVTSVDKAGLLDAAVATGSLAMPEKLPAPCLGTEEHPDPKGCVDVSAALAADGARRATDSGSVSAAAQVAARRVRVEVTDFPFVAVAGRGGHMLPVAGVSRLPEAMA
ncbi:hypothetical protein GCM10022284_72700 [Streptomyces hundungensis]